MKLIIDIDEEQFKDIKRIAVVQLELNHYTTAEQIIANGKVVPDNLQGWRYEETPHGEGAERALSIIDRLYTEGHINNMEQGVLRRAILLPEKGGAT